MSGPETGLTPEAQAEAFALGLGKAVVGRDLTADEADAMATIFKAAVQALRHGFARRLADHVVAERSDESIEEFFEDQIHPE
jgi:hypothetical protein